MNATALIDRLDDWINPIVVKELRQVVKSRVVIILMLVFLALQLFIVGMSLLYSKAQSFGGTADWNAGRDVFVWIQGVLAFTLILLVPAYACVRLAAERSDQNVDLLFISTLKPYSIVAGKFFAAFMLGVLIFSCCAPFMTFTYLLRGLDMPTILFILTIDLLALLYATMSSMLLASIPGGLVAKVIAIFIGYAFHLIPITIYTIAGTSFLVTFDPPNWESADFWALTAASMAGTLAAVGLMFTYCTALISPPSSNRLLLIRAYVLAIWSLSLLGLFAAGRYAGGGAAWMDVVIGWMIAMAVVLGLQFSISISERDQYGPRLQRQIPGNVLLRIPAFLLYGGAANGLVFTMALFAGTMVIGAVELERASSTVGLPPAGGAAQTSVTFQVCLVLLLYLYNYDLTAVLVRVYLLGEHLRSGFTWLIQMLLLGLGSAAPPLLAFTFLPNEMGAGNEAIWWKLPSPFLAMFNLSSDFPRGTINEEYLSVCLWFLGIWFVLVTLLSLPWLLRQVLAFHPRRQAQAVEATAIVAKPAEPAQVVEVPAATAEGAEPATSVQTG